MARRAAQGRAGRTPRKVDHERFRRTLRRLPNSGRTLVLDNDRNDLAAIAQKLKIVLGPEAEVAAVQDASLAADRLIDDGDKFDFLVINYGLGRGPTGLDLVSLLRKARPGSRYKVVLYSARMNAELVAKSRQAGADLALPTDDLDSMVAITQHIWGLIKPNIDWSASWRGLP